MRRCCCACCVCNSCCCCSCCCCFNACCWWTDILWLWELLLPPPPPPWCNPVAVPLFCNGLLLLLFSWKPVLTPFSTLPAPAGCKVLTTFGCTTIPVCCQKDWENVQVMHNQNSKHSRRSNVHLYMYISTHAPVNLTGILKYASSWMNKRDLHHSAAMHSSCFALRNGYC